MEESPVKDTRLDFIAEYVLRTLKMKKDKWQKCVSIEDNLHVLQEFLDIAEQSTLVVSVTASGLLQPVAVFPASSSNKAVYFVKHSRTVLREDSMKKDLFYGDLSHAPLDQFSALVEEVVAPLLSNTRNHLEWPQVVSQDVRHHVRSLQTNVFVVSGQVQGKTVLPPPVGPESREQVALETGDSQTNTRHMKVPGNASLDPTSKVNCYSVKLDTGEVVHTSIIHAVESAVIEWSHQIRTVLEKDYSEALLEGRNPTPQTELLFWKNRYANLECIHSQLQASKVKAMAMLLEAVESSYAPAFINMQQDVLAAMEEAKDICTYLRPLQRLFEEMESSQFPDVRCQIGPLMHTVCLVWANSRYYNTPARLLVLLQAASNLLIQQARVYLVQEEVLRGEILESLLKVQTSLEILQLFRSTYEDRRANLSQYQSNGVFVRPWDFSPLLAFSGLDRFINRIRSIEDILLTAIDLLKLDKLGVGGVRGQALSLQVQLLHQEFVETYQMFTKKSYDCLDVSNREYEDDVREFKLKVDDTDQRLGAVFCQAFDDASGLEHAFKVLDMFGSLVERPLVAPEAVDRYAVLVSMFDKELDSCKHLYNKQVQTTDELGWTPVNKNMPAVAGGLKWAKELQQRIQVPFSKMRHLPPPLLESTGGARVMSKYKEMMQLLDRYPTSLHNAWTASVGESSQFNLSLPLISRDSDTQLISVNFKSLLSVLREVKYLEARQTEVIAIPQAAVQIYTSRGQLRQYMANLELTVGRYNKVMNSMLDVEHPLVQCQISDINVHQMNQKAVSAPLFEAQLDLNVPNMVFTPSLEYGAGDGFFKLVESLVNDVFRMSSLVPRLAQHSPFQHFQADMEDMPDLADMRHLQMERVQGVMTALEHYSYLYVDNRKEFMQRFLLYSQMVTSQEVYGEKYSSENRPTLENFREQVDRVSLSYFVVVQGLEPVHVFLGWVRVDARSMKSALLNIIKKWSLMFKQHLVDHETNSLLDLEKFICVAETGLGQQVEEGYYNGLVDVLGHLVAVKERQNATDAMFEPLQQTITLLKVYEQELPDVVFKQLAELPERCDNVKKQAMLVKQQVAPLQVIEATRLHRECASFDVEEHTYREHFRNNVAFRFDEANPHQMLDVFHRQIQERKAAMASLVESASIFEVTVSGYKQLGQCRHDVGLLKELWDMVTVVESSMAAWRRTPWRDVLVEDMELECKSFSKDIRGLDKEVRSWDAFTGLDCRVKNLLTSLRSVAELQNPAMRDRHWHQLMAAIGARFTMDQETTLADLLQLNLHCFEEEVRGIVDKAVKEMGTEKVLSELKSTWTGMRFQYEPHHRNKVPLVRSDQELIDTLEDNQVQLQNLMSSKYIGHFLDEVSSRQSKLAVADSVISIWFPGQRAWTHLESIFIGSDDIRSQLPEDSRRFEGIDAGFKKLVNGVHQTPNVVNATNVPGLFSKLKDIKSRLSLCALAEYLDSKRLAFPRLYFISSAEMLDILSNGTNPHKVQKHLSKLFDNMAEMRFEADDEGKTGLGMYSKEEEYVPFNQLCDCSGQVEVWLNWVLDSMRSTVRHEITEAVMALEDKPRDQWLFDYSPQVALTYTQIWWTSDVCMAFVRLEEGYDNTIKEYYKKRVSQLNTLIMLIGKLTPGNRQKVMTICTIDVHARDVVAKMIAQKGVPSSERGPGGTLVRCPNHPIVINGNILELAGKNSKFLAHLTDCQCSDHLKICFPVLGSLDKSCGNIYKGLAQTGEWGCFDEFNRISVEVLSVVAVQVRTSPDAIREKKHRFNFMGEEVNLCPSVGIFITMNPGYAGRTENLKALFSNTLCKELLSKQDHYDWGLRAIKSVLVVAGSLKRGEPSRAEDQVLMRALRDFNIPKIVTEDMSVFMGLIGDLFPSLDVPRQRDLDLTLQAEDNFVLKIELLAVRHSVFVIGSAGTGKSQLMRSLQRNNQRRKRRPVWTDLNPKAVTNDELFGIINPVTREWKDGLFSNIMRDLANVTHNAPKWIVLDGDIDPMWIESLNTVMDDNKVLTLASNERIPLNPTMRLVFEISHHCTATLATVSRAGILYMNPADLGWNPPVSSWIERREVQSEKANMTILFDKYLPSCLDGLSRFKKIIPIPEQSMLQMLCYLLECLLTPENTPVDCAKEHHELYFVFATVWTCSMTRYYLVGYRVEFRKWWVAKFKTIKFPSQGTVFDYYIIPESKRFEPWSKMVPKFEMDTDTSLQACLVPNPNAETIRVSYFMGRLLERRRLVMLVENAGTGKSAVVGDKLGMLDSEKYMIKNVPFNYYTTSTMLQVVLEKPLEKKAGRNYGPPNSRRLIYFIDDMNMPEVDTYGTVQPHTLIRQHITLRYVMYDRNKLLLKEISVQYVSCMNPTAGSFTINPRLQRHFSVFALSFPGAEASNTIYTSILSHHLRGEGFPGTLQKSCPLVQLALAISSFLPTALKFHYIFNLRDLSNIFHGILLCSAECLRAPSDLLKIYLHESNRAYRDKLVEGRDFQAFDKLQADTVTKFYQDMEDTLKQTREMNVYCHFAHGLGEARYMAVDSWSCLNNTQLEALYGYNEANATLDLVLFEDAMAHICRINRILESPWGNALLVGVGGSGKQSLTRLAVFISNLEVFQITLRKGYSLADLKSDLTSLYMKAGVKNIGTVFLMTDGQVADEKFLVVINDLLASGEIPDLFLDDEMENIIGRVRPMVRTLGLMDSRENCWRFFIYRVRRQLKVSLCFSPVGNKLRVRSRKFPALVNCTVINWFHEWPQEAMESVSFKLLQEVHNIDPQVKKSVSKFMAYVHMSVNQTSREYLANERRYNYTTPKSFLEQIKLYLSLLGPKSKDLTTKMQRLENDLQKLNSTSAQVDDLKIRLAAQEVELKQKNRDADKLIQVAGIETEKVSKEKAVADEEEQKVAAIAVEVSGKQRDCEDDLDKAEPALLSAQDALNILNKNNLTELKSFGSPVVAVTNVTAAVMVLTAPGSKVPKDCSWKSAKVMMAKVDVFLDSLINFNKIDIPEACFQSIQPYLQSNVFLQCLLASKWNVAAGLCSWVINIVKFYEVYCKVEPKRQALSRANAELTAAQEKLAAIEDKIIHLNDNLATLTAKFEKATSDKLKYQQEAESTARIISLANRLVGGLASESVRWAEAVHIFQKQERTLCGDVLLITLFISYLGYFTKCYRLKQSTASTATRTMFVPIPVTPDLDPLTMLTDDADIAAWQIEGLPADRMSTENATILTSCQRWPLMVDPQLQGLKWIKAKFGKNLRVIRIGQRGGAVILGVAEGGKCLSDLTKQQNGFKITLKTLEDNLLSRLSSASGKFLADTEVVENLETTNAEIQRVKEAKVTEAKINEARKHYRPAAARASLLYFIMNDLNQIYPMYQFSLKLFSVVFHKAVLMAELDKVSQILLMNKEINPAELDFLLRYPVKQDVMSLVDFLSSISWGGIKTDFLCDSKVNGKYVGVLGKTPMAYITQGSHDNFRVFVSAEPSSTPEGHIIPQGILENSIKITNEPPTGMHANLHKALDNFTQDTLEMCARENEFKSILFALCYFHAVVSERRKFGPHGWNRSYPFNTGDLMISINVLYNYLEANTKVPYHDLRYLLGEIMYGGHITDSWDRRLCRTYLEEFITCEMMEGELHLAPGFPLPGNMDYNSYHQYIDQSLPAESPPPLYGLHPNAEIGFLTQTSEQLFCTVLEMQHRDGRVGEGGNPTREERVRAVLEDMLEKLPEEFNMAEMQEKAEERTPYQVVSLQECKHMNLLTQEIRRSLCKLSLGLKGELTMTSDMESLQNAIFLNIVPFNWTKRAYPSMSGMALWFTDLLARIKELEAWSTDFVLPSVVWLAGFFNPQSFLTAIMQATTRRNELPCDVTKKNREDFPSPPGMYMEGARWDTQTRTFVEAPLKELFPTVPVIFIKTIPVDKQDIRNLYQCPVYRTRQRGAIYVWTFNLKTKENHSKWILAGVPLLLQILQLLC
ncbi:LOW QUALITY PROTEIN: dynein axonemal heavy chain 9 [Spinachia spinachia]